MKRNASKRIAAALSAASIVLSCLSGCGGDGIRYAEVEGTVELNGKPLDKILVEFLPNRRALVPLLKPIAKENSN